MKTLQLLILTIFNVALFTNISAQSITTIDLPDYGTPKVYDSNDTIAVCGTNAGKLYYRYKHDATWVQISTNNFGGVGLMSVYNNNIYILANTYLDSAHSGIFVSSDLGQTWTQKVSQLFFQTHFQNVQSITSSDSHFAMISGSMIKVCNYSSLAIDSIQLSNNDYSNQMFLVDSTLHYSSAENLNGAFGGGFMSTSNFTSWTVGNNPNNLQNPICYQKGSQQLLLEKSTGKFITSNDSGLSYNYHTYTTNIPDNSYAHSGNIICGYSHFYVFKDTNFFHSSDGINWTTLTWPHNFFVWGFPLEILPNGSIVFTFGDMSSEGGVGLYTYNPSTNTFEDFMNGMHEMHNEKLSVNSSGNMNFVYGCSVYSKVNSQTFTRKYTSASFNSEWANSSISDNNVQYLDNTFQTAISPYNNCRTTDNWQTYQTQQTTGYSILKNDSILNIDSGFVKLSNNTGISFSTLNSTNPFNNWPCNSSNYNYRENDALLVWNNSYSYSNSPYPNPADNSIINPVCIPYSQDFGNTWTYTTHSDIYGAWWSNNPPYPVYPCLYSGNIYAICSFWGSTDTIYKYNFNTNFYETINHFDLGGGLDNLFTINGTFYIAKGGQTLDIYKTTDINSAPFTLVVSYPLQNSDIYGSPLSITVKNNKAYFTGFYDRIIVFQDTTITTPTPQTVSGKVFLDANNNNVFNAGEEPLQTHILHNSNGNNSISNYYGNYYYSPLLANDTLRVSAPNYYVSNPAYRLVNGGDTAANFALQPTAIVRDLEVHTTHYTVYRPGFQNTTQINYRNKGTVTQNAIVKYLQDSVITPVSYNPTPTSISGDTLIWSITNLHPQQTGSINIIEEVAATIPIGINANTSTSIFPTQNDTTVADNYFNTNDIVVGSYDPNEKTVTPKMIVFMGVKSLNQNNWGSNQNNYDTIVYMDCERLNYTINFQNTGTYAAFNVTIIDTLASNLDPSTIQMIGSSHVNYNWQIIDGNILKIVYPTINLPDSFSNEPTSHGFIKFQIKPYNNWMQYILPNNIAFNNAAQIYFDFNTAINTNQAITMYDYVGNTKKIVSTKFAIYPNPTKGIVTISYSKPISKLTITDVLGNDMQFIYLSTSNSNQHTISIQNFPKGIYFVKIENDVQKLIVE